MYSVLRSKLFPVWCPFHYKGSYLQTVSWETWSINVISRPQVSYTVIKNKALPSLRHSAGGTHDTYTFSLLPAFLPQFPQPRPSTCHVNGLIDSFALKPTKETAEILVTIQKFLSVDYRLSGIMKCIDFLRNCPAVLRENQIMYKNLNWQKQPKSW